MRIPILSMTCVLAIMWCCGIAGAYTVTFDNVSSGTVLRYTPAIAYNYHIIFGSSRIQAYDHTTWGWGVPHSSPNVMTWASDFSGTYDYLIFGHLDGIARYYNVNSVGAYFSTETDTVVRVTAAVAAPNSDVVVVHSVLIGGAAESWDNRYIELGVPGSTFNALQFTVVSGTSGLRGLCLDDMTVTPVPEPSSLLALLTGLAGVGAALRRSRGQMIEARG